MYTTNIIEPLNRQFRKCAKTKSIFHTNLSLLKCLSIKIISKNRPYHIKIGGLYFQNYLLCLMIEFSFLTIITFMLLFKEKKKLIII